MSKNEKSCIYFTNIYNHFFCRKKMFPPEPTLEVEKKPLKQDTTTIKAMQTFEHKIEQVSNLVEKTQLADEHNQFEAVLESNGISTFIPADNTTIENEIIIENINPMTVFRELENEKSETTIDVRNVNKNLQKQRLANENQIFRFRNFIKKYL